MADTELTDGVFTLHFDGGCNPNPGSMKIGFILRHPDGRILHRRSESIGRGTSNVAEFNALLEGLRVADQLGVKQIRVYGDSMLVVMTVNRRWKCKKPHLRPLCEDARELLGRFRSAELKHIPRHMNTKADALTT